MSKANEYRFEKISVREGLSNADVYCAMQDKQGFMWFGTMDGISRYDGYKFENYKPAKSSLSNIDNRIFSCFEDSNGILWFGYNNVTPSGFVVSDYN